MPRIESQEHYFVFKVVPGAMAVPELVKGPPPAKLPPGQVRFLVPSARRDHEHVVLVPEDLAQEFMRQYPLARVGRQTR